MNADERSHRDPQTRRAQGGVGAPHLGRGGRSGNATGPRDAHDPGATRYGNGKPRGSNEPRHSEAKEERGWTSRQGGAQGAGPGTAKPTRTEDRR